MSTGSKKLFPFPVNLEQRFDDGVVVCRTMDPKDDGECNGGGVPTYVVIEVLTKTLLLYVEVQYIYLNSYLWILEDIIHQHTRLSTLNREMGITCFLVK